MPFGGLQVQILVNAGDADLAAFKDRLVCKSAVQHLRRLDKRRILVGEEAMSRKNPLDVNTVNLDDLADRNAFYGALIADGAPLVREERMQAFEAGLIDARGVRH